MDALICILGIIAISTPLWPIAIVLYGKYKDSQDEALQLQRRIYADQERLDDERELTRLRTEARRRGLV